MNITNAEYFTFNVDNSMLLVGQTGSGKSYLQDRLTEDLIEAHTPESLQFVLLDMTVADFRGITKGHPEFVKSYETNPEKAFDILDEMAELAVKRSNKETEEPLIFICIEECDMAFVDHDRFDKALITINQHANQANMKLIFSTSRPARSVISEQLQKSFDLIIAGLMSSSVDYQTLDVPEPKPHNQYDFVVVQQHEY